MDYEVSDYRTLRSVLDEFCEGLKALGVSEEGVFDSRLVVSELAGNVLRHAGEKAVVTGRVKEDRVEVFVASSRPFYPAAPASLPTPSDEHGRGLYLVSAVSEECFFTEEGVRAVIRFQKRREE